jgi:hypothetical protein
MSIWAPPSTLPPTVRLPNSSPPWDLAYYPGIPPENGGPIRIGGTVMENASAADAAVGRYRNAKPL